MKGFSWFKSPLKQGYKPPKVVYDKTKGALDSSYNPESGTITMGNVIPLSHKEISKIERHETKHHHQVYKRGVKGHRRKDDLDFEKWFKKNTDFKKTAKMTEKEFSNFRENSRNKWRAKSYDMPGTTEYEARQAEKKASPGLFRKQ